MSDASACVLVLGRYRQTLTVLRSLHRAGFEVMLSSSGGRNPVDYSNAVTTHWRHGALPEDARGFGDELVKVLTRMQRRAVVFPVGELQLESIAHEYCRLSAMAALVMPAPDLVLLCLNKLRLYPRVQSLGLSIARHVGSDPRGLADAVELIGLPCVIKPSISREDLEQLKVLILRTPADIEPALARIRPGARQFVVQSYFEGVRHNCHFVARDGRMVAYFEQRVLRTSRLDAAGMGVDGISVEPTPALRADCALLVDDLQYSGPGCIQFLVNNAGEHAFLEFNPRLDATVAVAVACGVDLPSIAVQEALSRGESGDMADVSETHYVVGRRGVWTSGDLTALVDAMRVHDIGLRESLHWFRCTLRSLILADCHLVWSISDPKPGAFALVRAIYAFSIMLARQWRARWR
jgi:predicted ATP-grasp superfamily ATP-dependent carboligase